MGSKQLVIALAAAGMAMGVCGPLSAQTFNYDAFGGIKDRADSWESFGFDGTQAFHENFNDGSLAFGPRDPNDPHNQVLDDGDDAWPGMSWGIPGTGGPFAGQSGIGVLPEYGQTVDSDDPAGAAFGTLIHYNVNIGVVDAGETPLGHHLEVGWNLRIQDPDNPGQYLVDQHLDFSLHQWETENNADPCPRSQAGNHTIHGHTFQADGNEVLGDAGCDDAFNFEPLSMTPLNFAYGGNNYEVTILGFYEVDHDEIAGTVACTTVPLVGTTFWSPESQNNHACVRFRIDTLPREDVYVDIKPTSCPNPINANLNPRSNALVPAAILGTASLDVAMIDPTTVELCRGDDCIPAVRYSHDYAAAPHDGEPCADGGDRMNCTRENDDIIDLAVKFRYNDMLDTLGLRGAEADETFCLTIRAQLQDGTPIEGMDVIWINRSR